jgi:hypothetical protein
MTEESRDRDQVSEDELAAAEGEELPAREVMSILRSPDLPPPQLEEAYPPDAKSGETEWGADPQT